jgi:hypothetical protein
VKKKQSKGNLKHRLLSGIGRYAMINKPLATAAATSVFALAFSHNAFALYQSQGTYDGEQYSINLTTTVEYSAAYRVNNPSAILAGPTNANGNDGDSNLRHGVVSNQLEALPVFDVKYGSFGFHFSAEVYLNTVYLQRNQNNQPGTINQYVPSNNTSYTTATRNQNGEQSRVLDVFSDYNHTFADGQTVGVKIGRQTLLWGESLFFTGNGIAAGQAPIDAVLALSTPNVQAQQVFLPVGQAVFTYSPGIGGLTFQAYYQFEYMHDNFEGVGSYFSSTDILDKGGQRVILGAGDYLYRTKDNTPPSSNGQFGAAVMDTFGPYDVGLYALRYDSKAPQVYANFASGKYYLVYPRDIQIYGASLGTTVGSTNLGFEVSGRRNMPLVSGLGSATASNPGNANSDPLYAVGDTLAAQASEIYVSPGIPLDPGGVTIESEIEFNHVLDVTANKVDLTQGRQASAAAFETVVEPTYYDVRPNLDLAFPVGLTYDVLGKSQIDSTMNHGTGSVNVGVQLTYRETWIAGLTYNDYLGAPNTSQNPLADRGYVSFNIEHTF